jgi:hypothetical protein
MLRDGGTVQVGKYLPTTHEAMGSIPILKKSKEKLSKYKRTNILGFHFHDISTVGKSTETERRLALIRN